MRPQTLNPAKLASLFRQEFELCKVTPGETIVVLSDLTSRRDYVGAAFAAAMELGADCYEMCVNQVPSWTKGRVGGVVAEPLPPQTRACGITALGSSPHRFAQGVLP